MAKQNMIQQLESRIQAMKDFDLKLVPQLKELQKEVDGLTVSLDPKSVSSDKSVVSHVRKRTQKVANVIHRFKRDLNKVIMDLENGNVDESTDETVEA